MRTKPEPALPGERWLTKAKAMWVTKHLTDESFDKEIKSSRTVRKIKLGKGIGYDRETLDKRMLELTIID